MSLQERMQNLFKRNDSEPNRNFEGLHQSESHNESSQQPTEEIIHQEETFEDLSIIHQQWYQNDPERFDLEAEAMNKLGFETGILKDGRVCFVKSVSTPEEYDIAVICDWIYPLKPPSVFVESKTEKISFHHNDDGSVDVLSDLMDWEPNMAAVTVVKYWQDKLNLLNELNPQTSE